MRRQMQPFCRQRSALLCRLTGQQHSSFCGFPSAVSIGRASWSCPRWCRCWNLLHFVPQLVPVQKILWFWCLFYPASWLSFSVSGHNGFWKCPGYSRQFFRPRLEPAHRHYLPHTGRFPGAPQTGRHGRRTSHVSAPCSSGSIHPGSVRLCRNADAGLSLRPFLHQVSVFSFWTWTVRPSLSSGENGSFLLTFPP